MNKVTRLLKQQAVIWGTIAASSLLLTVVTVYSALDAEVPAAPVTTLVQTVTAQMP